MVGVVPGAAGGPKWLILSRLDRFLFGEWFLKNQSPVSLIGASSGAWRFACAAQNDPVAAGKRFENAYIYQCYAKRPSPEQVSQKSFKILDHVLGSSGADEVVENKRFHASFLTVRCQGWTSRDEKLPLAIGSLGAAAANAVAREGVQYFFERAIFHSPKSRPPISEEVLGKSDCVLLKPGNVRQALLASGSIPLAMSGVRDISGAPAGTYRDGGVVDYHLDLPYDSNQKIILYPHYCDQIIPGWLDKFVPWRKPKRENMTNVLLIAPSEEFLRRLPYGKIPDRKDFWFFAGEDNARVQYWKKVAREGERLRDAFAEAVEKDKIQELMQPLG